MLAPGSYARWKSHLMRYVNTKPNQNLLKKFIYEGPYELTKIILPDTPADDDNLRQPGHTKKETYQNITLEKQALIDVEVEAVHMILNEIGNDIYTTVDACPNTKEMWIAIERLQEEESINIQDVKTKLFWEFGKFPSRDVESIKSYYTRFYRMMNEMVRNKLKESRSAKRVKDYEYHKEKMLCKKEVVGIQLSEVLTATDDNSGPTYDTKPFEKVNSNVTLVSSNMSNNEREVDHDAKENED
ncbi:hypothetical protein Tco_0660981 [Tanacetum coccineum]